MEVWNPIAISDRIKYDENIGKKDGSLLIWWDYIVELKYMGKEGVRMLQTMNELIGEYVMAIRKIHGTHLKRVILYGSYARGDFNIDSDVDIMLLVDLPEDKLSQFSDDLSELDFDFNVDHDIWFMPVVKNIDHFNYWRQAYPFYSNVTREGVVLYEAA